MSETPTTDISEIIGSVDGNISQRLGEVNGEVSEVSNGPKLAESDPQNLATQELRENNAATMASLSHSLKGIGVFMIASVKASLDKVPSWRASRVANPGAVIQAAKENRRHKKMMKREGKRLEKEKDELHTAQKVLDNLSIQYHRTIGMTPQTNDEGEYIRDENGELLFQESTTPSAPVSETSKRLRKRMEEAREMAAYRRKQVRMLQQFQRAHEGRKVTYKDMMATTDKGLERMMGHDKKMVRRQESWAAFRAKHSEFYPGAAAAPVAAAEVHAEIPATDKAPAEVPAPAEAEAETPDKDKNEGEPDADAESQADEAESAKLDERLTELENRQAEYERQMEERYAKLEKEMREMKSKLQETQTAMEGMIKQIADLKTTIQELRDTIAENIHEPSKAENNENAEVDTDVASLESIYKPEDIQRTLQDIRSRNNMSLGNHKHDPAIVSTLISVYPALTISDIKTALNVSEQEAASLLKDEILQLSEDWTRSDSIITKRDTTDEKVRAAVNTILNPNVTIKDKQIALREIARAPKEPIIYSRYYQGKPIALNTDVTLDQTTTKPKLSESEKDGQQYKAQITGAIQQIKEQYKSSGNKKDMPVDQIIAHLILQYPNIPFDSKVVADALGEKNELKIRKLYNAKKKEIEDRQSRQVKAA